MATENMNDGGTAEAVLDEVDDQQFDAEATDEGTDATQEPAEQSPGSETGELSDADLERLAEQATLGIVPEESNQEDGEDAEEEETTEDEPETVAKATAPGKLPPRVSIKHLGDEAALVVEANDIARKEGIPFSVAAKRIGLFKAEQSAEASTAATPEAPIDNGQGTRDFAAELAEAEAAIEAAEREEAKAATSFDEDRIAAAKKAVRMATKNAESIERAQEQSEAAVKQAFRRELDGVTARLPDKEAFYDFLDTLPNAMVTQGKLETAARMYWAANHPDKPFPAAKAAAARTTTPVLPPKKTATPVAALAANGRKSQPNGIAAVIRGTRSVKDLSDEELEAASREF